MTLFASIYSDQEEPGSTLKRVPSCRVHFSHAPDRARVVLHRIFANYLGFDPERAQPTVDSYLALWRRNAAGDRDSLYEEMVQGFPFSPDLMQVLLERVPARGGFQNVRGALGFLAHLVRLHHKTADLLTPAHALLSDREVRVRLSDLDTSGDLISRAAGNLDDLSDQVPLAEDIASAVLLYTLTGAGRQAGATREELLRSVLAPGVDINSFEQSLLAFQKYASHFHVQEGRYFFDLEENADAKVEFRSLIVPDTEAREMLRSIWKDELFREPGAVFFSDPEETKTACEALDKGRLRYVLAPRRLKPEERHDLYHGLSVRNQVLLFEPHDAAFSLDAHPDLLKWAKRFIAARNLISTTEEPERRSQYERIGKEDKKNVLDTLRRAGLIYLHFQEFGSTPADDAVEEETLGSATTGEEVVSALSQRVFPMQLLAEHLGGRFSNLKGRTVGEVDREYRNTLGFPVPTHADSVTRAFRLLCRSRRLSVRHQRGNYCGEDPPLSHTELLAATVDDPFEEGVTPPAPPQPPDETTPDETTVGIDVLPPVEPVGARRETIATLPMTSAGALRQEVASRLQATGATKVLKAQFKVFVEQTLGDLSVFPAALRGSLSGQGALSAEVTITKEGEFAKGQVEQMAESLPSLPGGEYSVRLEVLLDEGAGE